MESLSSVDFSGLLVSVDGFDRVVVAGSSSAGSGVRVFVTSEAVVGLVVGAALVRVDLVGVGSSEAGAGGVAVLGGAAGSVVVGDPVPSPAVPPGGGPLAGVASLGAVGFEGDWVGAVVAGVPAGGWVPSAGSGAEPGFDAGAGPAGSGAGAPGASGADGAVVAPEPAGVLACPVAGPRPPPPPEPSRPEPQRPESQRPKSQRPKSQRPQSQRPESRRLGSQRPEPQRSKPHPLPGRG